MRRDKQLEDIKTLLDADDVQWTGYANLYGYPVHSVIKGGQQFELSYERGDVKVLAVTSRQSPDEALKQLSALMAMVARAANVRQELADAMKGRICKQAVIGGPTR